MRAIKELTDVQAMDDWFTSTCWFTEWPIPVRLAKVTIKVDPTGVLAIITGITSEGPVVGFFGASSVSKVWRSLSTEAGRAKVSFKEDKYKLDR